MLVATRDPRSILVLCGGKHCRVNLGHESGRELCHTTASQVINLCGETSRLRHTMQGSTKCSPFMAPGVLTAVEIEIRAGSYLLFIVNTGTDMCGATSSGNVHASPAVCTPRWVAAATHEASKPAVLFIASAIHCNAEGHEGFVGSPTKNLRIIRSR